jgi:hypothetical protein
MKKNGRQEKFFLSFACLSFLALSGAAVHGQVVVTRVRWQLLPSRQAKTQAAKEVDTITRAPSSRGGQPLGAVVVLRNDGDKPAVGVLLHYAVTAKIAPIKGDRLHTGIWVVPFLLEEGRVPEIRPGQEKNFMIRNLNLEPYLRKLAREGYWAVSLRLQVMAEPRSGEELTRKILEAELPVLWEESNK